VKTGAIQPLEPGGRHLKQKIREILTGKEMVSALDALDRLPARRVLNPLFSFLYQVDDHLRWSAITAIGHTVAKLADHDMESARIIMRRLMWNLNDESGGIGWGSPEAMGEILARHEGLAEEYAPILISYAREDGNYLEYEMLQRGLLWGIARLARARPHLLKDAGLHLMPYLDAGDPVIRGLAAGILGRLRVQEARMALERLTGDDAGFETWMDGARVRQRVQDMAKTALDQLSA